jgi:hypothetical protein
MTEEKDKKINPLATSATNTVTSVKIGEVTYKTNSPDSIDKVEVGKSIQTLEMALKDGVFSDLKNNEPENK